MPKPTTNPVEYTYSSHKLPHPVSSTTHTIAGITTTIYGLSELPPDTKTVACIYLLHPRLQTQKCMAPFAAELISDWNARLQKKHSTRSGTNKGLIAVAFDQRNHGSREVDSLTNEAWRSGNPRHAQDMFSSYHGTAVDTSLLIDYVAAYAFPDGSCSIVQNLVLGISLGGHAAWHVVMQDARVSAAVVVIGCPDYVRLMSDRARLSKRKTWLEGKGAGFLGSVDFPAGLVEAVARNDPAGLLWGSLKGKRAGQEHLHEVTQEDKATLLPLMARTFGNKRILNLSGGADKLVPYHCGKPFLDWFKSAIGKGGWFEGGGVYFEDIVVDGCGHEVPYEMVKDIVRFVGETLEGEADMSVGKRGSRESRI